MQVFGHGRCFAKRMISQKGLTCACAESKVGIKVQPVFISIDPERDSAKLIKSYVKEFHPRMIGLRGTMDEVRKVAKLYRVYFMRTNDTNDYLVDHSIIMVRVSSAPRASMCYRCTHTYASTCIRLSVYAPRLYAFALCSRAVTGPSKTVTMRVRCSTC